LNIGCKHEVEEKDKHGNTQKTMLSHTDWSITLF